MLKIKMSYSILNLYFRAMNFRLLLYPFSIMYDVVTSLRNVAYEKGWKQSKGYRFPVISVGNLSTGGTGKSPMIEYLIALLKEDYKVSVLSRGYKRKTNGFLEVTTTSTAEEVGDEPLQFKQKFKDVTVAVCANRQDGIKQLQAKTEVLLLDDAFQHRKVRPTFQILLTSFDDLYIDDFVLPAGNLRESKRGAKRATIIVVTKCPPDTSYASLQEIQYRLNLLPGQSVYFSSIGYDQSIHGKTESLPRNYLNNKPFTLVTGIANPKPLVSFLQKQGFDFTHKKYPDHHDFTDSDISELKQKELILTTEKDYMRLQDKLDKFALYYLPIKTLILNEQGVFFNEKILENIEKSREV